MNICVWTIVAGLWARAILSSIVLCLDSVGLGNTKYDCLHLGRLLVVDGLLCSKGERHCEEGSREYYMDSDEFKE